MLPRRTIALASTLLLAAPAAFGSGFLVARFGGEHGHPTNDDATATYYNPAGLALRGGTRLRLDGVFAYRFAAYERPAAAIDNQLMPGKTGSGTPMDGLAANAGRGTLFNFIASPFIGLSTDFGVKNLGVGVSFYAPFGGQAVWNTNETYKDSAKYPGGVDGVQRWATIDGQLRTFYVTAAGAYFIEKARLSIGVGVNFVYQDITTLRARNTDATDDLISSDGQVKEGRSLLDAKGFTASLSAGLTAVPIPDKLWIGVSYQSQPGFGETTLAGTLQNKLGSAPISKQNVEVKQALPDVLRLGFRYRPIPKLELRLSGDYVRWSTFQRQCVLNQDDPARKCKLLPDGSVDTAGGGAGVILSLDRQWKDAFGARVGASHWVHPDVELFLGLAYDGNAVSDLTLEPSLMDMDKLIASIGGRFEFVRKKLALDLTYSQVVYFDRVIAERKRDADGKPIGPLPPSRSPDQAGKYSQSIGLLALSLEYKF